MLKARSGLYDRSDLTAVLLPSLFALLNTTSIVSSLHYLVSLQPMRATAALSPPAAASASALAPTPVAAAALFVPRALAVRRAGSHSPREVADVIVERRASWAGVQVELGAGGRGDSGTALREARKMQKAEEARECGHEDNGEGDVCEDSSVIIIEDVKREEGDKDDVVIVEQHEQAGSLEA